jgi:predicted Zn-dependent peptidase
MAHFVEHTTFKGTEKRTSLQILNELERVGGDLNAFTTKEHTVYYATVLRDDVKRAVSLLTDIVFNSTYPQAELDKEIEVICDEIESYNDSPAELIFDEFENLLFPGHPLGHNILGTREKLSTYTSADALRFARRHYRPDNAVFFVYGDVPFERIASSVERGGLSVESGVLSVERGKWSVERGTWSETTLNAQPSTLNPQLSTLNPQLSSWNLRSGYRTAASPNSPSTDARVRRCTRAKPTGPSSARSKPTRACIYLL